MRRPTARALGILLVLAAVLAAASPPAAAHHTGTVRPVDTSITDTVTLPENNFTGYTIVLGSGETIGYDIRVVSGGNIDVYFVLTGGLLNYTSDTAVSIQAYALSEDARNVTGTFDRATGAVTVIVDNTDRVGAIPTGPVTVSVSLTKNTPVVLAAIALILGGAAILAIVLVLVLVRRRRTREGPAPPPPRPYAGPYAPPSQPTAPGEAPASGGPSSPPPASKDP